MSGHRPKSKSQRMEKRCYEFWQQARCKAHHEHAPPSNWNLNECFFECGLIVETLKPSPHLTCRWLGHRFQWRGKTGCRIRDDHLRGFSEPAWLNARSEMTLLEGSQFLLASHITGVHAMISDWVHQASNISLQVDSLDACCFETSWWRLVLQWAASNMCIDHGQF